MVVLGILVMILGLGLLMVVHEGGHLLVARAFGMRVVKFSIGFGPTLWRRKPKDSPTTYQVGIIPFLAYVQIAGMNPFEENDPKDKGSYANASLTARLCTIFAGPAANYLFASVAFFAVFLVGGTTELTMKVKPLPDTPAAIAGFVEGDKITSINGKAVQTPFAVKEAVEASADQPLTVSVERDGRVQRITVTPAMDSGNPRIGVGFIPEQRDLSVGDAAILSITFPAERAYQTVVGLPGAAGSMKHAIDEPDKVQFASVFWMLKYGGELLNQGALAILSFLAMISVALAVFNMLPIPALDGGRLLFIGYEAITRRKPDAKIEAHVHALGFLMLIAMAVLVLTVDMRRSDPTPSADAPALEDKDEPANDGSSETQRPVGDPGAGSENTP